jgi:glycosyltransferase involved in cell wall biosynthesis
MRVLVVVDNEYFNDPRLINEVGIALKNGHDVTVLCLRHTKFKKKTGISTETIIQLSIPKRLKNFLFGLQNTLPFYEQYWSYHIKKQIKRLNPDIIHAHDLYMSRAVYKATRKTKTPFILDLHENYPAVIETYEYAIGFPKRFLVKSGKWKGKEKHYLSYPDGIVVLSGHFKSQLIAKYGALSYKPFLIYPNVVNINQLTSYTTPSATNQTVQPKTILYFGVVGKRRGIHVTIKAARELAKRNHDFELVLIGPIDKAEIAEMQTLFDQDDIKKYLVYHPWKDISEIPAFISSSYLCLSPIIKNEQHESGAANKIFQYMLFEKPIIVSDCRPQSEIVEKHQCGFTFRSGDSSDLASKIEILLNNPELAQKMGKNAKKAILSTYNTIHYEKGFDDFYNEVANKNTDSIIKKTVG